MQAAAVAFLIGGADPLRFLAASRGDQLIQMAVLNEATKLDNDRRRNMMRSLIEGIGTTVGNRVGEILSRIL